MVTMIDVLTDLLCGSVDHLEVGTFTIRSKVNIIVVYLWVEHKSLYNDGHKP